MIFKRHNRPFKKKEDEVYYKLTENEVQGIKFVLIHATCYGSQHMVLHAGSVMDKIKCKRADEINCDEEYAKFMKESKLVDDAIEVVFGILDQSRRA